MFVFLFMTMLDVQAGVFEKLQVELISDHIAIGINDDGSLINNNASIGILWDPDGGGVEPVGGDILLPGNEFEVWSINYSLGGSPRTLEQGGPYLGSSESVSFGELGSNSTMSWLDATLHTDGMTIQLSWELPWSQDHIWLNTTFIANSQVDDLWMARVVDPDQEALDYESYSTDNWVEEGVVVAGPLYGDRHLVLAADGGYGGLCSWCTMPDEVLDGWSSSISDDQAGVALSIGSLSPGESVTVTYVYAFGLDSEVAISRAREAAASRDHDSDGVDHDEGDCDDRDPSVATGLTEVADGLDNDCDGEVDEETSSYDDDGDGYTEADGDCDDSDPTIYPGADPQEGVADADCDGKADDGFFEEETGATVETGGLTQDTGDTPQSNLDDTDTTLTLAKGGCQGGCAMGGPSGGAMIWVMISVLFAFQRRRRSVGMAVAILLVAGCDTAGSEEGTTTATTNQTDTNTTVTPSDIVVSLTAPDGLVMDPKLGGDPSLRFEVTHDGGSCSLLVTVSAPTGESATLVDGEVPDDTAVLIWNGRDDAGLAFDPGPFGVDVLVTCDSVSGSAQLLGYVVRLGPAEINFTGTDGESTGGHVPVAFHKQDMLNVAYQTIEEQTAEYLSDRVDEYDLADLDLNDGSARASLMIWENPNVPPWGEGEPGSLGLGSYNMPAAYVAGSTAGLVVTPGSTSVSAGRGIAIPAFGVEVKAAGAPLVRLASSSLDGTGDWWPGEQTTLALSEPLPNTVGRHQLDLKWQFEASWDGTEWARIPGESLTSHLIYLLVDRPVLEDGVPYGGSPAVPWLSVLADLSEAITGLDADSYIVLDAIREHIYYDPYIIYDPGDGAYTDYEGGYISWEYEWFYMSDWLDRSEGINLYCHSVACLTSTLAGTIGIDAPYIVISGNSFRTSLTRAAGTEDWETWYFNSHGVVEHDGAVWDAAVDLDGDEDPYSLPVDPFEPIGVPTDDYIDLLTEDTIWTVNSGYCFTY